MFKNLDVKVDASLEKPVTHVLVVDPQTMSQTRVLVEDVMIAIVGASALVYTFKTASEIIVHIVKTKVK